MMRLIRAVISFFSAAKMCCGKEMDCYGSEPWGKFYYKCGKCGKVIDDNTHIR